MQTPPWCVETIRGYNKFVNKLVEHIVGIFILMGFILFWLPSPTLQAVYTCLLLILTCYIDPGMWCLVPVCMMKKKSSKRHWDLYARSYKVLYMQIHTKWWEGKNTKLTGSSLAAQKKVTLQWVYSRFPEKENMYQWKEHQTKA